MVEFKKFENGFVYVDINNASTSAKIALQGAHLFDYARNNDAPLLWLSDESDFEIGKAIRGGVPICWSSFGLNNPELPQHGFARLGMWKLKKTLLREMCILHSLLLFFVTRRHRLACGTTSLNSSSK